MQISENLKEAILSYKLGKINRAINCFETSIKENPNSELVHEGLGICYMQIGNYQKSIENFNKVLELNSKNQKSSSTLISLLSFVKPKN